VEGKLRESLRAINAKQINLIKAAFIHAGLTARYRKESLHKSICVVKVTQYVVYNENRKSAQNCRHES